MDGSAATAGTAGTADTAAVLDGVARRTSNACVGDGRCAARGLGAAGARGGGGGAGNSTTNRAPPPSPRSTHRRPFCDSTSSFTTERPIPLPVTDLAGYAADRARRAAAIARHPSVVGDTDDVDG